MQYSVTASGVVAVLKRVAITAASTVCVQHTVPLVLNQCILPFVRKHHDAVVIVSLFVIAVAVHALCNKPNALHTNCNSTNTDQRCMVVITHQHNSIA
jgi:hypothetical protein